MSHLHSVSPRPGELLPVHLSSFYNPVLTSTCTATAGPLDASGNVEQHPIPGGMAAGTIDFATGSAAQTATLTTSPQHHLQVRLPYEWRVD